MDDWKGKVQKYFDNQRAKQQRQDEIKKQQELDLAKKKKEQLLIEHQKRFKCHYCEVPSEGPVINDVSTREDVSVRFETDWDDPSSLRECTYCRNLFCEEHILHVYHYIDDKGEHKLDVCIRCARKIH